MFEASQPPVTPASAPSGTSRRWFLAGGVAILLGGAGGAVADLLRTNTSSPPPPPPELLAAVQAERKLIADLDATTGGTPPVRRVIVSARADHAAHLTALNALLAEFRMPRVTAARRVTGTPRTLAQLRSAERAASGDAARRAAGLHGGTAALLASIAACEATHAELFQ